MESISSLAKKYNLSIIEDAAHALGSKYKDGSMVGSCKYSDMTGFSFHPVKSIAAGEGGMITTNNYTIYKTLLRIRSHGINKLDDKFINKNLSSTNGEINPWYYEMQELGFNYRITDFQCALGRSQLKKLSKFISKRKDLVTNYDNAFSCFKNIKPIQIEDRENSSHHLYVIRVDFKKLNLSRASIMIKLREKGIITQVHYIPVTSHPYYKKRGYKTKNYSESLTFYNEALSIPLYYSLTNQDQEYVIKTLNDLIG
jgi:dTDP-4-amino-4,6-dideoxygalactose transaminase